MASYRELPLRYRIARGISLCLCVIGVVGLVSSIPRLLASHHATTTQAFVFSLAALIVGVVLFLWSRRRIAKGLRS